MKKLFVLLAMSLFLSLLSGCGPSDSADISDATNAPVAVKGGTETPANFECLGGADPYVGTTDMDMPLHAQEPNSLGAWGDSEGVVVQRIDPADGSDLGTVSAATDGAGKTQLTLPLQARVAMKTSASSERPGTAPQLVTTYTFNYLTDEEADPPTTEDPAGVIAIPEATKAAFIGLLGYNAAEYSGAANVAGGIADCDGDVVEYAVLVVENAEPVHIGYFGNGVPDGSAVMTADDGQYAIIGMPEAMNIRLVAKIYDGEAAAGLPATEVAEAYLNVWGPDVYLVEMDPIRASE